MQGRRTALGRAVSDLEEIAVPANGGDWRMAWHPPGGALSGRPHGASAQVTAAPPQR